MKLYVIPCRTSLRVRQLVFAVFFGALSHLPAYANDVSIKTITLKDAIKRTLGNSPQLAVFRFKSNVLKGEAQTASLTPGYSLDFELEDILGTGELSGFKEAEATLTLSSVIELGNKVQARLSVVNAQKGELQAQQRAKTLDVLGEVNRRYIAVLTEQENLKLAKKALELAQYAYQAVAKRVEAGASPLLEKHRADAALAQARMDVLLVQKRIEQAKNQLAFMWGETAPGFQQVSGSLFKFKETIPRDRLLNSASSSPYLHIFAEQTRVGNARLRLAQANNQVDVSWTAGIRRMQGVDETALVTGISVPLFQKDRNLGHYNAQKARLDEIEQQRLAARQALISQLSSILYAREQALVEVQTIQQFIIPPLDEALTLVEQAYEDGRFSYLEWTSTRKDLLDKHYALIQAASRIHLRTADIESLTGIAMQLAEHVKSPEQAQENELRHDTAQFE